MNELTETMLRAEDLLEDMMEIEKRVAAEVGADVEQNVGGRCVSCDRVYPPYYLQNGDCIRCWREKNDLRKIDRDVDLK